MPARRQLMHSLLKFGLKFFDALLESLELLPVLGHDVVVAGHDHSPVELLECQLAK
jgi:hypothetical protein